MRAVRLLVKGFGPYVEEQEVDFQQLKDAGLFLITGPTGSGKTTLLDAICFGLYGDTSGGGRDGRQMRSDFLQPSQVTEITLDFDIGPESFRVRRTPVQVRPRRRGTGTTEEPAMATLWRRTGVTDPNNDGEVIASQPTNVTDKVTELLGFECNQFRQVVLLPQGEFRKFLSATSREREQILEVLFQTETFRHIEDELKSKAKAIGEEIQTARQRMGNFLEAAQAQSEDELRQRRDDAQQRLQDLDGHLEVAREVEITAQQTSETARATAQKLAELDAAEQAFSTVKESEAGVESTRVNLAAARKAEQLLDLERSVRDRVQEHAEALTNRADRQQERSNAEQAEKMARERMATEEGRREERAAAAREVQRLSELRDRVEKIHLAATEVEAAETQDREETAECGRLDAKVRDLTQQVERRDQQIVTFRASAQRADFLSLSAQKLDGLLQSRRRLDLVNAGLESVRSQFERANTSLSKKNEELQEARQRYDQLQSDWIAAQAAILAANLMAGGPCPVCGSTEHPAPASSETPLPEEQQLKQLRNKVRELEAQAESLRNQMGLTQNEVTRHETEAGNLATQLGEAVNTAVSQLADQREDTRRELGDSRQAADEVTRASEDQERDRRELTGVSAQLVEAKFCLQDASNRLAAARQALAERQDGVPESLRTPESLEIAVENASGRLEALTQAHEAARTAVEETSRETARYSTAHNSAVASEQTAAERARDAKTEFAGRLAQAGFDCLDDFSIAKLAISRGALMEEEVRQFEADLSATLSRLERARENAAGLKPTDMQSIERDLAAAKEKVASLLKDKHELSESAKSADRFLQQLKEAREKLVSLETSHGVFGKIADVACGDNQLRITFQRFVQGALFEDVLQAASLRLRRMSKGRFELQRALRAADGRQSGGLDIVVLDSHTGTTRPVSSLSGGEGFLASLSLALGLADVVQNHAGGVRLESLFIDEGFGSLDAEALDQALQVLTDLRQSGRSIGIISHVTELKERISARIEVVPQARGSVARIVGGIAAVLVNNAGSEPDGPGSRAVSESGVSESS